MTDECPHCKAVLRMTYHAGDGTKREGHSTIGVNIRGVYDGILFWQCPFCGGAWHRWPEGHHLRERANNYMGAQ